MSKLELDNVVPASDYGRNTSLACLAGGATLLCGSFVFPSLLLVWFVAGCPLILFGAARLANSNAKMVMRRKLYAARVVETTITIVDFKQGDSSRRLPRPASLVCRFDDDPASLGNAGKQYAFIPQKVEFAAENPFDDLPVTLKANVYYEQGPGGILGFVVDGEFYRKSW